jgi:hypothetical protein
MDARKSTGRSEELGKTAVIVAHPGHEMVVYHWMERHRPLYFCLTNGAGGNSTSRLGSTASLLENLGTSRGGLFGRYADREVYQLLVCGRVDEFVDLANELARALIDAEVDFVAGDAVEGFNPAHDLCRFLIDSAVERVQRWTGRRLRNHDFVLDSPPHTCPESLRDAALGVRLDEAAVARKLHAALSYPEMRAEVEGALLVHGKHAFAVECLRPAATSLMVEQFEKESPLYELLGQVRVNEGRYREVVRYRQHMLPVLSALKEAS